MDYVMYEYYWVFWKDVSERVHVDSIKWDETKEFHIPDMDYFGFVSIEQVIHNPKPNKFS